MRDPWTQTPVWEREEGPGAGWRWPKGRKMGASVIVSTIKIKFKKSLVCKFHQWHFSLQANFLCLEVIHLVILLSQKSSGKG